MLYYIKHRFAYLHQNILAKDIYSASGLLHVKSVPNNGNLCFIFTMMMHFRIMSATKNVFSNLDTLTYRKSQRFKLFIALKI